MLSLLRSMVRMSLLWNCEEGKEIGADYAIAYQTANASYWVGISLYYIR